MWMTAWTFFLFQERGENYLRYLKESVQDMEEGKIPLFLDFQKVRGICKFFHIIIRKTQLWAKKFWGSDILPGPKILLDGPTYLNVHSIKFLHQMPV